MNSFTWLGLLGEGQSAPMPMLTGGQALAKSLVAEGVDTMFGLPGDRLMNSLDALYAELDHIRYIATRHEQATTQERVERDRLLDPVGRPDQRKT